LEHNWQIESQMPQTPVLNLAAMKETGTVAAWQFGQSEKK